MAKLKFSLKSAIFKIRSFGDLLQPLYSNGLSFIGSHLNCFSSSKFDILLEMYLRSEDDQHLGFPGLSFAQLFMKKVSEQDSPFLFKSMAV